MRVVKYADTTGQIRRDEWSDSPKSSIRIVKSKGQYGKDSKY